VLRARRVDDERFGERFDREVRFDEERTQTIAERGPARLARRDDLEAALA
jgi:hypothetical protein